MRSSKLVGGSSKAAKAARKAAAAAAEDDLDLDTYEEDYDEGEYYEVSGFQHCAFARRRGEGSCVRCERRLAGGGPKRQAGPVTKSVKRHSREEGATANLTWQWRTCASTHTRSTMGETTMR